MVFWRRSGSTAAAGHVPELERNRAGPALDDRQAEAARNLQLLRATEPDIQRLGREILDAARSGRGSRLSRRIWSDNLMQWAMRDPAFKTQLFRFVDVFPMLRTPRQIHEHLKEYLSQPGVKLPTGLSLGLTIGSLFKETMAGSVASQIRAMAGKFILATDMPGALPPLQEMRSRRMAFSLDLLGEVCVSDAEAQAYQRRYLALLDVLSREVAGWPANPVLDSDSLGPIPRANISVKISSLSARIKPADAEGSLHRLTEALQPILAAAASGNVFINFDMEQHELKDLTIDLFQRCCEQFDFPAGLAMQAYLQSGPQDAARMIAWAKRTGRQVTVRLIKGAYWDYETIHAEMMDWPRPVWPLKRQTDSSFEQMAAMFLSQMPRSPGEGGVKLAIGSHNVRSIATALALAQRLGLPESAIEFQMLYGMADELKAALVDRGLRLRVYAPIGQMIPGMAYLVRRLLENTSNESWLRAGFAEDAPAEALLASPHEDRVIAPTSAGDERKDGLPAAPADGRQLAVAPHTAQDASKPSYTPVTPVSSSAESRGRLLRLPGATVRLSGPCSHNSRVPRSALAGRAPTTPGATVRLGGPCSSVPPVPSSATPLHSHPSTRVPTGAISVDSGSGSGFHNEPQRDFSDAGTRAAFAQAIAGSTVPQVHNDTTVSQALAAVETAWRTFRYWRDRPILERTTIIRRFAAILRSRRDELSGIIIRESGKTWVEADADVCEAIDFADYYASESIRLFEPQRLGQFIGEFNQQWHEPRGVAVIISPWNFPLSICTGMTTASLVTGNTALVKPAEQTPGIARVMCEALWQAGVPRRVLHFLPGPGETVGAALVRDPRVAIIAFTGSKAVGLDILQAAGTTPQSQDHLKHVVCEMGGKNAIIVDESADLDEAVLAVRQSAFSFAGQKCSACSRAIVLSAVHDVFLGRLVEATRSLVIGDPMQPATDIGPVIDNEAAARIRAYIDIGLAEGWRELACPVPPGLETRTRKSYIGPHIFSAIRENHRLAQEEIFGPVLSVMRARDFDEALHIANSTAYKLTGGVFSRTPSHLEQARREFRVGNLYLNRGITGAMVARQPFGGFGLSGTGTKAGGREYLLQFVHSRVSTENTLRHGFAPESGAIAPGSGSLAPAGE